MTIEEFFNLSLGQWFTQRTSYLLNSEEVENSKAEITTTTLNLDAPEVKPLREKYSLPSHHNVKVIKSSWNNSVDWDKPKEQGSALLIFVGAPTTNNEGDFYRYLTKQNAYDRGQYYFSEEGILTLTMAQGQLYLEERQWFASENLRLRNTLVKEQEHCHQTAFYSEIRRIGTNEDKQ